MFERESWDNQTCEAVTGDCACYICARSVCALTRSMYHVCMVIRTTCVCKSYYEIPCCCSLLVRVTGRIVYVARYSLLRSLSLHGGLVNKLTVSVTDPIRRFLLSCDHEIRA